MLRGPQVSSAARQELDHWVMIILSSRPAFFRRLSDNYRRLPLLLHVKLYFFVVSCRIRLDRVLLQLKAKVKVNLSVVGYQIHRTRHDRNNDDKAQQSK